MIMIIRKSMKLESMIDIIDISVKIASISYKNVTNGDKYF